MGYRAAHLSTTWNLPNFGFQLLSLAMYAFFLLVYNFMALKITAGMLNVPAHVFMAPMFWIAVLLSVTCQLACDLFLWYVIHGFTPDAADKAILAFAEKEENQTSHSQSDWEGSVWFSKLALKEQDLKSFQLIYRPMKTWLTLLVVGAVFLAGSTVFDKSNNDTLIRGVEYTSHGSLPTARVWMRGEDNGFTKHTCNISESPCNVELDLGKEVTGMYLLSYRIMPFYQNYNDYLKNFTLAKDSFMNDTFAVRDHMGNPLDIDDNHMAWPTDKKVFEKWNITWNEHLAVWMRPSSTPTAVKKYGYIYIRNKTQKLTITVNANYDSEIIQASKAVVVSSETLLYGKGLSGFLKVTGGFFIVLGSLIVAKETYASKAKKKGGSKLVGAREVLEPLIPSRV